MNQLDMTEIKRDDALISQKGFRKRTERSSLRKRSSERKRSSSRRTTGDKSPRFQECFPQNGGQLRIAAPDDLYTRAGGFESDDWLVDELRESESNSLKSGSVTWQKVVGGVIVSASLAMARNADMPNSFADMPIGVNPSQDGSQDEYSYSDYLASGLAAGIGVFGMSSLFVKIFKKNIERKMRRWISHMKRERRRCRNRESKAEKYGRLPANRENVLAPIFEDEELVCKRKDLQVSWPFFYHMIAASQYDFKKGKRRKPPLWETKMAWRQYLVKDALRDVATDFSTCALRGRKKMRKALSDTASLISLRSSAAEADSSSPFSCFSSFRASLKSAKARLEHRVRRQQYRLRIIMGWIQVQRNSQVEKSDYIEIMRRLHGNYFWVADTNNGGKAMERNDAKENSVSRERHDSNTGQESQESLRHDNRDVSNPLRRQDSLRQDRSRESSVDSVRNCRAHGKHSSRNSRPRSSQSSRDASSRDSSRDDSRSRIKRSSFDSQRTRSRESSIDSRQESRASVVHSTLVIDNGEQHGTDALMESYQAALTVNGDDPAMWEDEPTPEEDDSVESVVIGITPTDMHKEEEDVRDYDISEYVSKFRHKPSYGQNDAGRPPVVPRTPKKYGKSYGNIDNSPNSYGKSNNSPQHTYGSPNTGNYGSPNTLIQPRAVTPSRQSRTRMRTFSADMDRPVDNNRSFRRSSRAPL